MLTAYSKAAAAQGFEVISHQAVEQARDMQAVELLTLHDMQRRRPPAIDRPQTKLAAGTKPPRLSPDDGPVTDGPATGVPD